LGTGGYAFLKERVNYQPKQLRFNPNEYKEAEKEFKQAVQNNSSYSYRDSDWLQTDANLPEWYDYRQQIKNGLEASLQYCDEINNIYINQLPIEIQLPKEYQTWRFNIRLKNKDRLLNEIFVAGLFASSHYASLAGIMAPGQCKQAETLADEIINLFNDHHFDTQKAEQTCAVIMENLN